MLHGKKSSEGGWQTKGEPKVKGRLDGVCCNCGKTGDRRKKGKIRIRQERAWMDTKGGTTTTKAATREEASSRTCAIRRHSDLSRSPCIRTQMKAIDS